MISKSLSTSEKRAALHEVAGPLAEFCQALYPLMVAHADDWGCLQGDAFTVKHLIDPASPRSVQEFATALMHLHNAGLITWYPVENPARPVENHLVIHIRAFSAHQFLKGHDSDGRPRPFPPPPDNPKEITEVAQGRPNLPKRALTKENLTEENLRRTSTGASRQPVENSKHETEEVTFALACVVMREALESAATLDQDVSLGNVAEHFKQICAGHHLAYDRDIVRKAYDAVTVADQKRA